MPALLTKLMTLIALALMPLGMAAAPAAAMPVQHHVAAAADTHCPDSAGGDQQRDDSQRSADCATACAGLIGLAPTAAPPPPIAAPALIRPLARRVVGLHPEAATPPPRFA